MERLNALVLICAGLAVWPVAADTVVIKETDLKIEGKVLRETPQFIVLVVNNGTGELHIAKKKIKSIEYDVQTQLETLEPDDYAGRYKVALWAMEKGLFEDAITQFLATQGKEGIPPELHKFLGLCYENRGELDKALAAYKDYLKTNPADAAAIQDKVKKIEPEVSADNPAENPKAAVAKGLESDGNWIDEKWDNANPCTVLGTPDAAGKITRTVAVKGGEKDKTAFSRTGPALDLTGSSTLVLHAFHNSTKPLKVALALVSADGFFESRLETIPPNVWTDVKFDLTTKTFKSAETNWEHKTEVKGKDRIVKLSFLIYQQLKPCTLYVDGVYFPRKDEAAK